MQYLLLGGPAHGESRELELGQRSTSVIVPGPDNVLHTFEYVLREIEAETRPGVTYKRKILVEQSMPVNVAAQALGALLLQNFAEELLRQFMEGGELVGPNQEQDTSGISSSGSGLLVSSR